MSTQTIYSKDGIYRSPRPPICLPQDPNCSMIKFLFRNLSSINSNLPALIDAETSETLTFSDLKTQVIKLSKFLLSLYISKDDVVLILSPNSIRFPVAFFAVIAIGAIATTANPQYTIHELSKQVKDSNPKLIITIQELFDKVKHFNLPCIMLNTSKHLPYSTNTSNNLKCYYYSEITETTSSSSSSNTLDFDFSSPNVAQNDAAAILYSSGTSGTSKGAVLTHRNFIASALMMTSDQETHAESENVILCFLPMFHVFALSAVVYAQLQILNTVVVMERYEMKKMSSAIEKYKVTHLFVVPPVVIELTKHKEMVKNFDVSSLREIVCGAAPLGRKLMQECSGILPQAVVYQAYGMTETGGVISIESIRERSTHSGSTGVLASGVEAQIVNLDTTKPLPQFQIGEIWVRGPLVMKGYYKNDKATMETLDDQGWLRTGDLGYFDDDGRLYVVDRIKELIKYKGFQVAPAELEELLLTHPEIIDAVVIGLPDAEAGEIPIAYVVRSSTSSLTREEVEQFIAKQVAPFKRLRGVIFTNDIPKSPSGKILRRELRQKFLSKI